MAEIISFTSSAANSFIIPLKDGKCILVDALYPGKENVIFRHLERKGYTKDSVSLIILTHSHVDHAGSIAAVKEATGAPVLVHEEAVRWCKEGVMPPNSIVPTSIFARFMHIYLKVFKPSIWSPFEPDIVVSDDMFSLADYGAPHCTIVHTPGHTDDSISILWKGEDEQTEIVVGDCIGFRVKGGPGKPVFAVSIEETMDSMAKIADLKPTVIHVGHMGPFRLDSLKRFCRRMGR